MKICVICVLFLFPPRFVVIREFPDTLYGQLLARRASFFYLMFNPKGNEARRPLDLVDDTSYPPLQASFFYLMFNPKGNEARRPLDLVDDTNS